MDPDMIWSGHQSSSVAEEMSAFECFISNGYNFTREKFCLIHRLIVVSAYEMVLPFNSGLPKAMPRKIPLETITKPSLLFHQSTSVPYL